MIDASAAISSAGMSEAGSPCATEPPIVPRLRTCGSAIVLAALARMPRPSSRATAAWRVIAPIRQPSPSRLMPARPGTFLRSTSSDGAAKRSFISGSSECPPASSLASSPPSRRAESASSSEAGAT